MKQAAHPASEEAIVISEDIGFKHDPPLAHCKTQSIIVRCYDKNGVYTGYKRGNYWYELGNLKPRTPERWEYITI